MSRVCAVCGKGKLSGNNVSHSNMRTRRTWGANIQKVKIDIDGKISSQYVCTRCLKTAKKDV